MSRSIEARRLQGDNVAVSDGAKNANTAALEKACPRKDENDAVWGRRTEQGKANAAYNARRSIFAIGSSGAATT